MTATTIEPVATDEPDPILSPPPPPAPSALDRLAEHHATSVGPVNHSEIASLIAAIRGEMRAFFGPKDEPPTADEEGEAKKTLFA